MRNTKTMLLSICVFITTVLLFNTITWYLEDTWTFKECFKHGATLGMSVIFGWLPATIVGRDYYTRI
jgi:hypothetical protein